MDWQIVDLQAKNLICVLAKRRFGVVIGIVPLWVEEWALLDTELRGWWMIILFWGRLTYDDTSGMDFLKNMDAFDI